MSFSAGQICTVRSKITLKNPSEAKNFNKKNGQCAGNLDFNRLSHCNQQVLGCRVAVGIRTTTRVIFMMIQKFNPSGFSIFHLILEIKLLEIAHDPPFFRNAVSMVHFTVVILSLGPGPDLISRSTHHLSIDRAPYLLLMPSKLSKSIHTPLH